MKTITYTQMRSDLSATLELLRSGEKVLITQRGKPDLIIIEEPKASQLIIKEVKPAAKQLDSQLAQLISSNISPQMREGIMRLTKQLDDLLRSDEARQALTKVANTAIALQGVSESFIKALQHTQIKHAEIIKKLEDK